MNDYNAPLVSLSVPIVHGSGSVGRPEMDSGTHCGVIRYPHG